MYQSPLDPYATRDAARHPTLDAPPPSNGRHLRDCLGGFATGVTIVTTRAPDGGLIGLTVNSFNSLSLVPALILWSLGLKAGNLGSFMSAAHFTVNVLAADQQDLALRFSRPHTNRFSGVALHAGLGGAPLIAGALAWFECETRAHHVHGDHVLFIGEVRRCARAEGRALVFHDGRFAASEPLPREPRG